MTIPALIPIKNNSNGPGCFFEINKPIIAIAGAIPYIAFLGIVIESFFAFFAIGII